MPESSNGSTSVDSPVISEINGAFAKEDKTNTESAAIDWVDSSVLNDIDTKFSTTFSTTEQNSSLQLKKLNVTSEHPTSSSLLPSLEAWDIATLQDLRRHAVLSLTFLPTENADAI